MVLQIPAPAEDLAQVSTEVTSAAESEAVTVASPGSGRECSPDRAPVLGCT